MMLLDIQQLQKQYQGRTALHAIDLHIPKACIFGLLGPNGAGKTSLIRILMQILKPESGEILFQGEKLAKKHLPKMGYLPEERGLYPKMKVLEQILYLGALRGLSNQEAKKQADFWLETLQMQGWEQKKVTELSKGMAQKVQFVLAVLHNPDVLILDEPFSGFDPNTASLVRAQILALKAQGKTIILSSHNMDSVQEMCDYVALLHQGNKVLDGAMQDILENHSEIRYKLVLAHAENARPILTKLDSVSNIAEQGNQIFFNLTETHALNSVLQSLIGQNISILSCQRMLTPLREIFIQKTQL